MSNELFVWLNQNQGAVIAVLTFVYVIVTTIYVITSVKIVKKMKKSNDLVRESNELSRQALIQSMQFEKERNRPYVIFDLILRKRAFYAIVKNIGKQPAYDVKITTEPEITRDIKSAAQVSFIEKGISFLAPNREIQDFVDVSPSFLKKHPATTFSVDVSYKDSEDELYQEKSNISTGFHMNRMSTTSLDNPIKNIERHLKDIANNIRTIASRK